MTLYNNSDLEIQRNADQRKMTAQTRFSDELENSDMNEVRGLYIMFKRNLTLILRKNSCFDHHFTNSYQTKLVKKSG